MSDFTDLVARAVNPSMSREEREKVYAVVRQAVLRLQEKEALDPRDPRRAMQRHLVEETIRDIESDIGRFLVIEKMRAARAMQDAENAAQAAEGA